LILREWFSAPLGLSDASGEITTLAVVHEDAQPSTLREAFAVADDVWMLQFGQQLALLDSILHFFSRSFAHIYHFAD